MFFKSFRRKQQPENKLTPAEIDRNDKWNKMWELWSEGNIESPYNELMSYHGEVNNGGHYQFFSNTDNIEDTESVVEILCGILPADLKNNLKKAYKAYVNLENDRDVVCSEQNIENCDNIFYEKEDVIVKMLENYSKQF